MAGTEKPSVIPLRTAPPGLEAASQERVALALTLMTKYALEGWTQERADTASAIAGALQALASGPELSPELRRLCGRLQRIWAAVENGEPM